MATPRKDINSLSADELGDYIHAFNILSARPEDDPKSLAHQIAIHNDSFVGPCEHGTDTFLPWHRAHLHYFEKLLQASDSPRTDAVTIPYWDFIHEQVIGKYPPAFAQAPLLAPGRSPADTPLPPDTLEIVTGETNQMLFAGFPEAHPGGDMGRLESGPHNDMHDKYIQGKMKSPATAAEDPIYWSFHCFHDLLWAVWQQRNGSPPVTSPDRDLRGFSDQPKHKVADFQNPLDLDYEYELTDELTAAFAVGLPEGDELRSSRRLERTFRDVQEALRDSARLQWRMPALPPAHRRVFVALQALSIPIGGNYMMRGYLHPDSEPFDRDDERFLERYSVGYVSIWRQHTQAGGSNGHGDHGHGAHNPAAHHPTTATVRFDITRALAATDLALDEQVLTIHYLPSSEDDDTPPPADLVDEVNLEDAVMEVYD